MIVSDMESNVLKSKTENGDVVYVGSKCNLCCICGKEVPEGIEVCPNCEAEYAS